MNPGNIIIIAALIAIVALAVYGTVRRIRFGSSCCGEHDAADKKIKVADRNKSHYPFVYLLNVDGMHCANCARRIENAFNEDKERWASADIGKRQVIVRSKHDENESELRTITAMTGYTMLSCKKT